jgi:hypothetical protein
MSQRKFAERLGLNHKTVGDALRAGKITQGVARDPATGIIRITDAFLAEKQWREVMDPMRVPPGPARDAALERAGVGGDGAEVGGESFQEARRRKEIATADMKEIELRKLAGELVEASKVEAHLVKVFSACKTQLLGIPSRAKQTDTTLTLEQVNLIDALIREACEQLALGSGAEPGDSSGEAAPVVATASISTAPDLPAEPES